VTGGQRPGSLKRPARRGVILLDVVLALAVLALAALVLVPRPTSGVSRSDLHVAGAEIAALIRHARARSVAGGLETDVLFNRRAGEVSSGFSDAKVTLPQGAMLEFVASSLCPVIEGERALRFLADGRSCGGVLTLGTRQLAAVIRVDWMTGRVDMDLP
jgi:general secretion pathway protein H